MSESILGNLSSKKYSTLDLPQICHNYFAQKNRNAHQLEYLIFVVASLEYFEFEKDVQINVFCFLHLLSPTSSEWGLDIRSESPFIINKQNNC